MAETVGLNHPKESGMSHQDTDGNTASSPHHQALKQVLDWLVKSAGLSDLVFREECTWTSKGLIFTAILWAWSDEKTLTDRFFLARKVVVAIEILARIPATSYQAFLKMLRTWTVALTSALVGRLSPTHADRPCRPVQGLWISGLRRGRQPSRIAPHRVQRRAIFARQGVRAVENRNRGASHAAVRVRKQPAPVAPARRRPTARKCG